MEETIKSINQLDDLILKTSAYLKTIKNDLEKQIADRNLQIEISIPVKQIQIGMQGNTNMKCFGIVDIKYKQWFISNGFKDYFIDGAIFLKENQPEGYGHSNYMNSPQVRIINNSIVISGVVLRTHRPAWQGPGACNHITHDFKFNTLEKIRQTLNNKKIILEYINDQEEIIHVFNRDNVYIIS